jgi:hypothetical protein
MLRLPEDPEWLTWASELWGRVRISKATMEMGYFMETSSVDGVGW